MNLRRHRVVIATALALAVTLLAAACSGTSTAAPTKTGGATGPVSIGVPPSAPTYGVIAKAWNKLHPDQQVKLVTYNSPLTSAIHDQLAQNFQAKTDLFDGVIINHSFTAEFAARGWVAPLDKSQYPLSKLLQPAVQTAEWKGKLYAVPLYTDTSMLYYRTDLVKTPPTTMKEVAADCAKIDLKGLGMSCYSSQYAQYEGLSCCTFQEAITSAGGSVLSASGKPTVDTKAGKTALTNLVNEFKTGLVPQAALTYTEQQALQAFDTGKLVFMRNWSYAYSLTAAAGPDSVVQNKFNVAPLPGYTGPGASVTGGWELMQSSYGKNAGTVAAFGAFALQKAQQLDFINVAGQPPVLASLYDQKDIIAAKPFIPVFKKAMDKAVPQPESPSWPAMSTALQQALFPALEGQMSVDAALKQAQSNMEAALQ
jgi:multiple sugar transport system substrate-binding protein